MISRKLIEDITNDFFLENDNVRIAGVRDQKILKQCYVCEDYPDSRIKWIPEFGWETLPAHYIAHARTEYFNSEMKQNLHADMSKIALAKYLPWSTHYDEAYCTEREFGKYLHPKYKETKNLVKTKLSRLKNSDTDSDSEHFSGDGHTTTEEKLISSSEEETQLTDSDEVLSIPEEPQILPRPDDEISAVFSTIQKQNMTYQDKVKQAPLNCPEGGPHCKKFQWQTQASLHYKLYHGGMYQADVCDKCLMRFETAVSLELHQSGRGITKCDPSVLIGTSGNPELSDSLQKMNKKKARRKPLSSESDIEVKTPARQNTEKTSQKFRQKSSTPDDECVEVLNEGRKSLMPKRPTKQLKPSDKLPTKTPPVIPAKLPQKPTSVHTDNSVLPDNSAFHKSVSKNKKDKRMKKMKNKKLKKQKIIQPPGESIMIEDSDSGEEAAQSYSDDDQPLDQIISVKFSDRATKELTDKFDNGCFIASGFKDLNNNSKICIFCMKSFDVKLPEFENHMKKCLQTLPFP